MVKRTQPDKVIDRGLQISRLGLRLTSSFLGYQLQNMWLGDDQKAERQENFQKKASHQIRESLGTLKGPVMKLGQMLSMQSGMISSDAIEELAALQMHAPGMHPTLARAQFKSSIGKCPEQVFQQFEVKPFAAASLGQVHRAVTKNGETIAVKIQYPDIQTAVANDFKLLRSASVAGRLTGHIPKEILDEIETRITQETDYMQEGKHLELFRAKLKPLNFVEIPKVYWEYTSDRVLSMSYLKGSPLGQWLEKRPSIDQCDQLGSRLFELFWFQVLRIGTLHADPHPGNYLYADDGRIGLVDFGCVKELSPSLPEILMSFVDSIESSEPVCTEKMIRLIWGSKKPRKDAVFRKVIKAVFEFSRRVFPPSNENEGIVDFGDPKLVEGLKDLVKEVLQSKLIQPEFVFYKRAELGLYNVLRLLKARVPTREIVKSVQR